MFVLQPTQYMLTIELGNNCTSNDETCTGGRYICEVSVLDARWNEKRVLDEEKTKCADREPNTPPEFIGILFTLLFALYCLKCNGMFFLDSTTIATSLPLEDTTTKAIAEKAVVQMGERRGGKHTLKHIGQARKVMVRITFSHLSSFIKLDL